MPLIVEDGTGRVDAESYISAADANTYHTARGNAGWDEVSDKEAMLRRATEYMVQMYRTRWLGFRTVSTQALDWPRGDVPMIDAPQGYGAFRAYIENDVVPVEVKRACAELALLANSGDLAPPIDRVTTRERVGEIEVEYDPAEHPYKRFPHIDRMLAPFIGGSSVNVSLTRV